MITEFVVGTERSAVGDGGFRIVCEHPGAATTAASLVCTTDCGADSRCDGINHFLSVEDLHAVFSNVADVLVPRGVFGLDASIMEWFETRWRGSFGIVTDDDVVVAQPQYDRDEQLGRFGITALTREGPAWQRLDVSFAQRGYPLEVIHGALAAAGLGSVDIYDAADIGTDQQGRVFVVCRNARD